MFFPFYLRHLILAAIAFHALAPSLSAFDFAELEAKVEALAAAPYVEPEKVPRVIDDLNYDQYRAIQRSKEGTLFDEKELNSPFFVEFMHPGYLFDKPVKMNLIDPETREARPFPFQKKLFNYDKLVVHEPINEEEIAGYGGFKIAYPLNEGPKNYNEIGAFSGSSYFRLLGKDQRYGLSARGLAINTSVPDHPEEFPAFLEYWIVEPREGDKFLEVFALLDSPSVAGAYRFEIEPGVSTDARIEKTLFFRKENPAVGIAPLTSMFWFAENHSPRPFADWRPEVHDSDGLLIKADWGETIWRPLYNHHALRDSYFQTPNVRGFGLMQRDRDFTHYQDLINFYYLVPSAWIEPKGDWGQGAVRVLEIPTDHEAMDNVVSCFQPYPTPKAGDRLHYAYTLSWKMLDELQLSPNRAISTRVGEILQYPGTWRFVVDFVGPDLNKLPANAPIFAEITSSSNGYVSENQCFKNVKTGGWRIEFKLDTDKEDPHPIELRCHLKLTDTNQIVSETWNYQWSR